MLVTCVFDQIEQGIYRHITADFGNNAAIGVLFLCNTFHFVKGVKVLQIQIQSNQQHQFPYSIH